MSQFPFLCVLETYITTCFWFVLELNCINVVKLFEYRIWLWSGLEVYNHLLARSKLNFENVFRNLFVVDADEVRQPQSDTRIFTGLKGPLLLTIRQKSHQDLPALADTCQRSNIPEAIQTSARLAEITSFSCCRSGQCASRAICTRKRPSPYLPAQKLPPSSSLFLQFHWPALAYRNWRA